MTRMIDMTGQKFGLLTAVKYVGERRWKFKCDCGGETITAGKNVRNGNTLSCGCEQKRRASKAKKTHGMTSSSEYGIWRTMKSRCYLPSDCNYHNYGGRGIKVCDRWVNSFENFLADMGRRPSGMSIDRIDANKGYEPDNCRWTNDVTQANNRRNNRTITYKGETLTLAQWSKRLGGNPSLIRNRLNSGWSVEKIVTTPVRKPT